MSEFKKVQGLPTLLSYFKFEKTFTKVGNPLIAVRQL